MQPHFVKLPDMSRHYAHALLASLSVCFVGLSSGCTALPSGERDARDPLERVNRSVYRFNDALDRNIARPVAVAYTKVTPSPVRTGVSNFFGNLSTPTTIVNNLLQFKPVPFFRDSARFLVNTTMGIGGLFDVATPMGLKAGDEDFGQTLGRWKIPAGPYLMLPILGPSSVRDLLGEVGDEFTDPSNYITDDPTRYGLAALDLVDSRAGLLQADGVVRNSFDPYVFVRNAYLERRQFQVKDGVSSGDDFELFEEEPIEDTAAPEAGSEVPAEPSAAGPSSSG